MKRKWSEVKWDLFFEVFLTRCMAEERGGCGSISSWEGTWPHAWIWASITYEDKDGVNTGELT